MRKWNAFWPSRAWPKSLSIRLAIKINSLGALEWNSEWVPQNRSRDSSIEPMQRGNTVILLEILCLGGDLCRVELDLFWIFFGFDFNEPLDWVFNRFGQVV